MSDGQKSTKILVSTCTICRVVSTANPCHRDRSDNADIANGNIATTTTTTNDNHNNHNNNKKYN